MTCTCPNECSILNKILCCFFKIWSFGTTNWSKEYIPFSSHKNYSSISLQTLKQIILDLSIEENPDEIMMTDLISDFIHDPEEYLKNKKFTDMSWRERVLALFYLVKRQNLLAPPKCFCSDTFKVHIKKNSSKRKHEVVRFFIKRYMLFLMDKSLPKYYILKAIPQRKKAFYQLMKENGCPEGSKDLMKLYFNEVSKDNIRGQKTKSLGQLFTILKNNSLTSSFFFKKNFEQNYQEICIDYNRERVIKIEKFLIQFRGKPLLQILKSNLDLLKNKRFKLFFSKKDMDVGMNYVYSLL